MHFLNQKNTKINTPSTGFTIVELIVIIVVSGILLISLVSFISSLTKQYGVSSVRNAQTTQLSLATDRIDNDIKGATAVLNYSPADPSGPSGAPWQTSSTRLVLSTSARNSSNEPIPGSNGYATDTIIYYLNEGSLYRRILAANYPGNRYTTKTCAVTVAGGCSTDTKLTDNVQSLTFTYFAKGDNTTEVTLPIATGNVTTVKFKLILARQQSGQTISTESNTTSPLNNKQAEQYSLNGKLYAGPGGMSVLDGRVRNGSINIVGDLALNGNSTALGEVANPITLNVSNIGCTVSGAWPRSCLPTQPISGMGSYSIYGTVCASGQTTSSRIFPASGLQPNCNPVVQMPAFDKKRFTDRMTLPAPIPGDCNFLRPPAERERTFAANTTYTGNFDGTWCTTILTGDTYIKGDFIATTSGTIKIAEGVTKRPTIVVNGRVKLFAITIVPNSAGVAADFISFKSSNSACSTSPTCFSPLSESDQKDTITGTQYSPAVELSGLNGQTTSFYAYYGRAHLLGASAVGPLAGQYISLQSSSLDLTY